MFASSPVTAKVETCEFDGFGRIPVFFSFLDGK